MKNEEVVVAFKKTSLTDDRINNQNVPNSPNSCVKFTVNLRGVFWGKQYSVLCINGKYINLYIIGELISLATRLC